MARENGCKSKKLWKGDLPCACRVSTFSVLFFVVVVVVVCFIFVLFFCCFFCKRFLLLYEYSFVCFLFLFFLMIRMIFNLHHYISLAYFVPSLAVHCFNLEKKITVNFLITINNKHLGNDFDWRTWHFHGAFKFRWKILPCQKDQHVSCFASS